MEKIKKPVMTHKDIYEGLRKIKAAAGNSALAHKMEDDLYLELLEAIESNNCNCPSFCARIALLTQKIKFARMCTSIATNEPDPKKCGLCHRYLSRLGRSGTLRYGSWGWCHSACVEQYEAEMNC